MYASRTVCALMVMPRSRSMSMLNRAPASTISRFREARRSDFDQAVGQRRLAVVDMRDDREVADVVEGMGGHGCL